MATYFRRMIKYLIYLIVLFSVIFIIMNLTGSVAVEYSDLSHMFSSDSGLLLLAVFVGLGLLQPIIGYIKREIPINPTTGREKIMEIMHMCGYQMVEESGSKMRFRATSVLKKVIMLFEDEIVVNKDDLPASISGSRRAITTILYRMETLK